MMVTSRRSLTMSFKMRHSPTHLKRQGVSQELSPQIYIFVCNIPFRCLPVSVVGSLSMDASYSHTTFILFPHILLPYFPVRSPYALAIFKLLSGGPSVRLSEAKVRNPSISSSIPTYRILLLIVNVNGRPGVINNTALFFLSKSC